MQSSPSFQIKAKADPIGFESSAKGSFVASTSCISVAIDEVPFRLAIPFLKRRCQLARVASIGGFKIRLKPFKVKLDIPSLNLQGVLGTRGIEGKLDTQVACKTKVEMAGECIGKFATLKLDLGDEGKFDEKGVQGDPKVSE